MYAIAPLDFLINICSMDVFLHICCGPCALYPLEVFKERGIRVTGFFYNPNIHPYMEFERRVKALEEVVALNRVDIVWATPAYGLRKWLSLIGDKSSYETRCPICYEMRMDETAKEAKKRGFDLFSTTLLYSKYQRHELIRKICEAKARKYGIDFYYEDFRVGWKTGIEKAVDLGIYRQPYCGCIFSEQERYLKRLKRLESNMKEKEVQGSESHA